MVESKCLNSEIGALCRNFDDTRAGIAANESVKVESTCGASSGVIS